MDVSERKGRWGLGKPASEEEGGEEDWGGQEALNSVPCSVAPRSAPPAACLEEGPVSPERTLAAKR